MISAVLSPGYFLVPSVEPAHALHSVGGSNESGAVSPNSGKPLLRLMTVDLSDQRIPVKINGCRFARFYYSWTCGIHEGPFYYKLLNESIAILKYQRGISSDDFPYAGYPTSLPAELRRLELISQQDQDLIQQMNVDAPDAFEISERRPDLATPRCQIGGVPRCMQWPLSSLKCPECGAEMPVFASVGDSLAQGFRMTGNEFVQVVYHVCLACAILGAYNLCD